MWSWPLNFLTLCDGIAWIEYTRILRLPVHQCGASRNWKSIFLSCKIGNIFIFKPLSPPPVLSPGIWDYYNDLIYSRRSGLTFWIGVRSINHPCCMRLLIEYFIADYFTWNYPSFLHFPHKPSVVPTPYYYNRMHIKCTRHVFSQDFCFLLIYLHIYHFSQLLSVLLTIFFFS